jgi:hypothetical protein
LDFFLEVAKENGLTDGEIGAVQFIAMGTRRAGFGRNSVRFEKASAMMKSNDLNGVRVWQLTTKIEQ